MGFIKRTIGATMLLGATVGMANAATEWDIMLGRVEKYAKSEVDSTERKGLCVCQDGSSYNAAVGEFVILETNRVNVLCFVRQYGNDGNPNGYFYWCNTFVPLAK
jgi:hypothetical protein